MQKVYIDLNREGGDQVGRQSLGKGIIPIHKYVKIDKEGNTERTMLVLFENKNDKYEEWVNTKWVVRSGRKHVLSNEERVCRSRSMYVLL